MSGPGSPSSSGWCTGSASRACSARQGCRRRALGVSLFSFNLGVEIGQAIIVIGVAWALRAVQARDAALVAPDRDSRARSSSCLPGTYWFIQRVF